MRLTSLVKCLSQHLECGVEVDSSFVVSTEKELNARAVSWGRILGVGAEWGHEDPVKQSLISTSSYPPPIYGLPKDHKVVQEGDEHPLRPVCGASSGPGARISNLLAMVISPSNDQLRASLVESTEDLQARIEQFNSLHQCEREDVVLFSMDAKALYPSIQIERTGDAVYEVMCEADVKYRNINILELARYLAVILGQDDIVKYGLEDLVMRRHTNLGRKPKVTKEFLRKYHSCKDC